MSLREKLLVKVKKGSFLYSVLTITSGTVIAQAITVLLSPVITRLYTPEDMGVLASYTAVTSVLGVVAAGCYQSAIVLPKTHRETNAVAYAGLGISVILGCLITFICVVFKQPLINFLKFQEINTVWFYVLGFFVALLGINAVLDQLAIKNQHFRMIAERQITQQISTNGIKIAIGCVRSGSFGLFFATFFGQAVNVVKMGLAEINYLTDKNNRPTKKEIWEGIKRYKKFPLVSSWSVLLNSASTQLPVILFATLFSSAVAGYYSLAHRILNLPMTLIGNSIGTVYLQKAASVKDDKEELGRITYEVFKKLLLISSLIMGTVIFFGDVLFSFVFGKEWYVAGQFAQYIAIFIIVQFVYSPLSCVFSIYEKQKEGLLFQFFLFISRFSIVLFLYLGFDIKSIILIFSLTSAFIYCIGVYIIFSFMKMKLFLINFLSNPLLSICILYFIFFCIRLCLDYQV